MASQGPLLPTSAADDGGGGTAWTTVTDALSSTDGNSAANNNGQNGGHSNALLLTGFGFTIPSGATIDGIVVEINKGASASNRGLDAGIFLIKGGVVGATDKSSLTTWPGGSFAVSTYGTGTTDLWGDTWAASDINASNFGVAIRYKRNTSFACTGGVDYAQITVYYTPATGGPFPHYQQRANALAGGMNPLG